MKRPLVSTLCLMLCLIASAFGGQKPESVNGDGKYLDSVTFDFRIGRPSVGIQIPVRCSASDKVRACYCQIGETSFLPTPVTFRMTSEEDNGGHFGILEVPSLSVSVAVICGDRSGTRTPNITMLTDFMGETPTAIKGYQVKARSPFSDELPQQASRPATQQATTESAEYSLQLNEKRLITEALQRTNGDTAAAARKLGITEKGLIRKLKQLHISL